MRGDSWMKKLILLLTFIFLGSFVSGAFQSFNVPSPVPLGGNLLVSGQLDNNSTSCCSFATYDANGDFIWSLSDEPVSSSGVFSSTYYRIDDPPYAFDKNYTLTVFCGSDENSSIFSIGKPVDVVGKASNLMIWIKDTFLAALLVLAGIFAVVGLMLAMLIGKLKPKMIKG